MRGSDLPGQSVGVGATPDGTYYLAIALTGAFESAGSPAERTSAVRVLLREKRVETLEKLDGATFLARRLAARKRPR